MRYEYDSEVLVILSILAFGISNITEGSCPDIRQIHEMSLFRNLYSDIDLSEKELFIFISSLWEAN